MIVVIFKFREWDASKQKVVHHAVPLLHTLTLVESKEAYKETIEIIANLPMTFANNDDGNAVATRIEAGWCGIDCCYFIASALHSVWPSIIILLCWAHIAWKFKDKKLKLKHTTNIDVIEAHVHELRNTISRAQFFYVLAHVTSFWAATLDEKEYAKSFLQFYAGSFEGPEQWWHANWYRTASGMGGITPVSQCIENYNGGVKVLLGKHALYASLSYFFSVSLVKVVLAASKMIPSIAQLISPVSVR